MSQIKDSSLEAAIELGFITNTQLDQIYEKAEESNLPGLEIAIRKGLLNRRELGIIDAFRSPGKLAPGYRVDGLIGQGGAGVVYMATQLGLDRTVAIKTICDSVVKRNDLAPKRFEREAKIIGQLRHPNIVAAVDFGVHNDQLYLVMEFVKGVDAEKYLADRRRMPESDAWHVARQVCHALSYAKELDVIHRDIKPGNLLLTTPPKGASVPSHVPFVQIADFGLARFQDSASDSEITMEGSVSGTPFYMSPEQIFAGQVDHRSDIFSLGATIWHLIVGSPPIVQANPVDVLATRVELKDDWASECPEQLSVEGFDLLREMCRFDREERIGDFAELDERILAHLNRLEARGSETIDWTEGFTNFGNGSSTSSFDARIAMVDDVKSLRSGRAPNESSSEESSASDSQSSLVQQSPLAQSSPIWKWLAALALLALCALMYQFGWSGAAGRTANKDRFEEFKLEKLTGPPRFLFDGLSVDPTQKFDGTWEVGEGAEKETILSGNGSRDFKCVDADNQAFEFFQFRCGFRQHQSEQIQFRLVDATDNEVFRVEITESLSTLQVGQQEQNSLTSETFDKESLGYQNIQIESHPQHWRIAIDSNLLGTIAKKDRSSLGPDTIQLSVSGDGNAHFEQIQFRRFATAKNPN